MKHVIVNKKRDRKVSALTLCVYVSFAWQTRLCSLTLVAARPFGYRLQSTWLLQCLSRSRHGSSMSGHYDCRWAVTGTRWTPWLT